MGAVGAFAPIHLQLWIAPMHKSSEGVCFELPIVLEFILVMLYCNLLRKAYNIGMQFHRLKGWVFRNSKHLY